MHPLTFAVVTLLLTMVALPVMYACVAPCAWIR
jgi:hypothetical protein